MHDQQLFLRTLSDFARHLVTPYDVDDTLQELAERTASLLGVAGSAVSLMAQDRLSFATAVPEELAVLERTQLAQQEGPCVLACRTGEVVAIADLTRMTTGWDTYRAVAADLGIGAVAGVPMRLNGATIGALNLYARGPREWSDEDLAAVRVLADMCTGLLLNGAQLRQQQQLAEQLQGALDSRVVIEQAKGIIGHTHGESVGQAFARLRRHARNKHLPLRSVAQDVVDGGLRV